MELVELISVDLCTVKWRSRSISVSCCLGWRGYETSVRMDLYCFGDSFGVEKNFVPFFFPTSVEEVVLHSSHRKLFQNSAAELVHPIELGEPQWHRMLSAGPGYKLE